ncbi:Erythronolide synthase, modules 3 and 4 [Pirellulimonas nuda]|uniref:Erythronolide synthase, modules 3 and 4 n=1 Tax=Pirellulimonas nuda TaxID=2528009 RepID=A0A518DIC2_9BACT|nr:beta-ketoacyl synthase N-terminal-like domain-containing protein [Pirellulimonas nuda]QDU91226.1 Erythronolide synthase, modules 3 and 4 [Pirellulimonas nuda]
MSDQLSTTELSPETLAGIAAALKDARSRLRQARDAQHEPLAVVGIGCRFPGAADLDAYWRLLSEGRSGLSDVPADRWGHAELAATAAKQPGKIASSRGGFLDGVDQFDAGFFGLSSREAASLDPQHRVFFETAWTALEDAGLETSRLRGSRTGVFLGICSNDYLHLLTQRDASQIDAYLGTGNAHSTAVGRLSYWLGLVGPSVAIDTACSSSLTAIHYAAQSVRSGESDLAIAGGVNLMLSPELSINLSQAGMLSPRGEIRAFAAGADGFVRGEGCGVVVLKRLSAALADGDRVWAVLRGTAVGQDGRSNGLTAPSGPSQQAVIRQALAASGLKPADIDYIEAHGTGTELGDPTEMGALGAVFGERHRPLAVGSVKTNIGHLEGAAGVAGLIKACLALHHGQQPPTLNFAAPSPHIDWSLPLEVSGELRAWPEEEGRVRRAGVSSFGFGGANAHAVLESAPNKAPGTLLEKVPDTFSWVTLSARTPAALAEQARRWAGAITPATPVAETAAVAARREAFDCRLAIHADTSEQLVERLGAFAVGEATAEKRLLVGDAAGTPRAPIGLLFGGQGAVRPRMGKELYERFGVFAETWDRCEAILAPHWPRSLRTIAWDEPERWLLGVDCQPLLVAWQASLAALWRSWVGPPAWVLGHSLGEFAAAVAADRIDLEAALPLVCVRARALDAIDPAQRGAMLAVMAPVEHVESLVDGTLAVASLNGPRQTVVSGSLAEIEALKQRLGRTRSVRLETTHAFHSALVEPALAAVAQAGAGAPTRGSDIGFFSTLTGAALEGPLPADYWARQLREPVRFHRALMATGASQAIEVSPAAALTPLCPTRPLLASGMKPGDEAAGAERAAIELWTAGYDVNRRLVAPRVPIVSRLPGYPFQRRRHWFSPSPASKRPAASAAVHPLLGERLDTPAQASVFEVDLATLPWLEDHRVAGRPTLPAAAYLELAIAAGVQLAPEADWDVSQLSIDARVAWASGESCRVQTHASRAGDQWRLSFYSRGATGEWQACAAASLTQRQSRPAPLEGFRTLADADVSQHYAGCRAAGLDYGPAFQGVKSLRGAEGFAEASLCVTGAEEHECWTPLVDAALQALAAAFPGGTDTAWVPVGVDRFTPCGDLRSPCRARAKLRLSEHEASATVQILDPAGSLLAEVEGLRLRPLAPPPRDAQRRVDPRSDVLFEMLQVSGDERVERLTRFLRGRLAGVLDEPEASLSPTAALDSLGLDSLMAYELRDDLQSALGLEAPMELFLQELSLRDLAAWLGERLTPDEPAVEASWVEGAL